VADRSTRTFLLLGPKNSKVLHSSRENLPTVTFPSLRSSLLDCRRICCRDFASPALAGEVLGSPKSDVLLGQMLTLLACRDLALSRLAHYIFGFPSPEIRDSEMSTILLSRLSLARYSQDKSLNLFMPRDPKSRDHPSHQPL
jgi:hypothetical protein